MADVIKFPRRSSSRSKQRRPAKQTGAVLQFTGTKRYVYDRDAVIARHRERMLAEVRRLYTEITCGEITGLIFAATKEHYGTVNVGVLGICQEDQRFADNVIGAIDQAHEIFLEREANNLRKGS